VPGKFDRLWLFLPGWVGFMLYLPSLSHGFVWDDTYFLTDLPLLRDPDLWWRQIGEPLFVSRNYFRPLPLAMFAFEARWGGLDPFVFHFVNVVLHAANATLVVLLVRAAMPSRIAAAAGAGLLFAVHPALVENVAWISDRFDLAMAFLILLALLCDRRLSRPVARAATAAALFVLALLCKETAVVLLVLMPLWQALRKPAGDEPPTERPGPWSRADAGVWVAMLFALLAYLALRYGALGYLYQSDSAMARGSSLQHLLLVGKTIGWYFALAVWPFGLTLPVHPGQTPLPLDDPWAWAGLGGSVAAGIVLVVLLRRPRWRRPALAAGMALMALAPVSNLVPLTIGDNLVHDRYLILPVAFLVLALALAWDACRRPFGLALPAAAWAAAAAVSVVALVPHWESNMTLWSWAYAAQSGSRIASENYVAALVNANRNEETVAAAEAVLALRPDARSTVHNLALALARLGRYDEAERAVRRAIELQAGGGAKDHLDMSEAQNLLGYICLRQGRIDEAERALRLSIALTPYLTRPHYNLAVLLYQRGERAEGDRELAFAERYGAPELAEAHRRFGREARDRAAPR